MCAPFEVKKCHTFITEATFGLPIFTHPEDKQEAKKLLNLWKIIKNTVT